MADLGALADEIEVLLEVTGAPRTLTWAGTVYMADSQPPGKNQVSGTVTSDAGAPASRLVSLVRRDTSDVAWRTYSDPTTGAYALPAEPDVEYQVVFQDDDAGTTYNDIVARVTPT